MVDLSGATDLSGALPRATGDHAAIGLSKAAQPGRARGTALELYADALDHPRSADGRLRRGLRKARYLHSRERRLVADGLYDLLRHRRALATGLGTPDPLAAWLGWLVVQGLDPDEARAAWAVDDRGPAPRFAALQDPAAALRRPLEALDAVDAVALAGSVDPTLAEALLDALGEAVGPFLAASNQRAPTTLRAVGDRAEVAASLAADGVSTEPGSWSPTALHVQGRANLPATDAWRHGRFAIQDEGSQVLAALADPSGTVVDYCAGAGGKTLAMAAAAPEATLVAADVRHQALSELRRRAKRAGVEVRTVDLPREGPPPDTLPPADRVLVDAPCTGSGVLRRHPAYRLRITGPEIDRLPPLQRSILDRAATLVKPGGRLIYATCSVLRAENDGVLDGFLADHADFAVTTDVPLAELLDPDGRLRLRPDTHGTDAFFAAVLQRAP